MLKKRHKILIAEDMEENRTALKMMLEMTGYDVIEARDGKEAVEITHIAPPHLILMDITLPIIDGLEASKQIRRRRETATLPIIIVSGHDTPEILNTIAALKYSDYINKPVDFDELKKKIDYHLSSKDR